MCPLLSERLEKLSEIPETRDLYAIGKRVVDIVQAKGISLYTTPEKL
jgi:hypothetical protein